LKKLIHGRIKIAIVEEFASRYSVHANFPKALGTLTYSDIALQENDLHVAFTKTRPDYEEVRDRFNKALADMKMDGTFHKILAFHGVQSAIKEKTLIKPQSPPPSKPVSSRKISVLD
jgi:ABC-type amino acid transport substrate-binding protein